jgi:hypothetical protein
MARQRYSDQKLTQPKLELISMLNGIIDEYLQQGFRLTVRQLYYQTIARDTIPDSWIDPDYNRRNGLHADTKNTVKNYKRLAGILDEGKMAGLVDWDAIEDRTREFVRRNRYTGAKQILEIAADSFHMDMWVGQPHRCFVVVEKEALAGVLEPICRKLDVPLLAARGYPSGTVLREFAESDLVPCFDFHQKSGRPGPNKQEPVIIHLGDHDPSGIDMSRDLSERFMTFILGKQGSSMGEHMFRRVALNMDQIEEQQPPPNPAKQTDARFQSYSEKYGTESWELDALQPSYLVKLVRETVEEHVDKEAWSARKREIETIRKAIKQVASDFEAKT